MTSYHIKRFLLDVVYPNKCPFCNEVISHNQFYCPACPENLGLFEGEPEPLENIAGTFAVFKYSDRTSPFVYTIKEGGNAYAVSAAAKLLGDKIGAVQFDIITCIPTDSVRMRERGYNPPALISKEISLITGISCDLKLLAKTRRTEIQKSLSAIERHENLRGAFEIGKKGGTIPKTVLLVDDVRTTGATLLEAAACLLSSGAEKVYAAVVAVVERGSLY